MSKSQGGASIPLYTFLQCILSQFFKTGTIIAVPCVLTEAGVQSTCRAPWFDTRMAATPKSAAIVASSAVRMPLRIKGNCVKLEPNNWSRSEDRIQSGWYRNKSKMHITYRSKTEDSGNGFIRWKVLMDNILMVK